MDWDNGLVWCLLSEKGMRATLFRLVLALSNPET